MGTYCISNKIKLLSIRILSAILIFFQMDELDNKKDELIDTSLITVALSGATGGAMIGAFIGGIVGAIVGGAGGTLITGISEFENRKMRRKRLKEETKTKK